MNSQNDAVHMLGMGRSVALFLLEVAKRIQANHYIWTELVTSRDMAKICYATERREGCTDCQERGEQVEQGFESRLHKYRGGESVDTLFLSA